MLDQCNFDITHTGMVMKTMDSSKSSMLELKIPSECFEEYQCTLPIKIGIPIRNFYKVLRLSNPDDTIELKTEAEGSTLEVLLVNHRR
jgi:proliferating cell nuclear antigen PCNA